MDATTEVVVTLTDPLWDRLRREAARLDLPIEWLIAGLVCDTLERPERSYRPSSRPALARQRADA